MASIALAACAYAAADQPFVDCSQAELIKAAPELTTLQFDSDQSKLDPLLRATGAALASMIAKFINVSMTEEIHEMRFDSAHIMWKEHHETGLLGKLAIRANAFTAPIREQSGKVPTLFVVAGILITVALLSARMPSIFGVYPARMRSDVIATTKLD